VRIGLRRRSGQGERSFRGRAGIRVEDVIVEVQIVALLASPIHAYEGRPADGPRSDPTADARERIDIRAGHGIVGDRYAGHPAHRAAAVTVFAAEALEAVATELGWPSVPDALLTRRNIVLRGFPVDTLAAVRGGTGGVFSLDSGDGPVRFQANRAASPCRWMDEVLAPGAFRALRGRGGVRCTPLDDGVLRRGPALLDVLQLATTATPA
jgi:MOSC domain-containing protein YiiM